MSNRALAYVLSGGAITTPLLKKAGTGTFTRDGGESDLIGEIELNEGFLAISNQFDAAFATILTDASAGLGTFVKQGPSVLLVSAVNADYDGAVLIAEGTLRPTSTNWFGTMLGGTTIRRRRDAGREQSLLR